MQSSPVAVGVHSVTSHEDVEADEQSKLQLDGDERGKLEQTWAADDLAKEHIAGSGQRQRACFRDRGARAPDVGFVELQCCAQLHDRRRRVPDGREPVAHLVVGVARMDAPRVAEHRLEDGADLVGAALEEVRMEPYEALVRAAIGSALRAGGQRTGEGYGPSRPDVRP